MNFVQGAYPVVYTARGSTHVSSGLVRKYYIRLERLARDKHSSLIALVISEEEKKRYNIDHRYQSYKKYL